MIFRKKILVFFIVCVFLYLSAPCCTSSVKYRMAKDSYDQGISLKNMARDQQSIAFFRRTISFLKSDDAKGTLVPEGRLLLGNCYLYLGDYENARMQYWQIININEPETSSSDLQGFALLGLGDIYEQEGYVDAAREFYEIVLSNSSVRTRESYPEAAIRWADVMLRAADEDRNQDNPKEFEKKVSTIIKKLTDMVHQFPSHANLRRALGNTYYIKSEGTNTEDLNQALTHVLIALEIPSNPIILQRILINDFNIISENLLQAITDPLQQEEFRKKFFELSNRWNIETGRH
ncbi:MAG: hypothetical protein A2161_21045 [Candidatus Schekmanbacteria bacterium RBG_13_48_7]|uniref:Uncharacterized protein n=1 Tax=Candidatus Schekmanbacteria bacterium RBG_13_48_7 TaxID=1817878 RepID=A0A1F7RR09_9BACT|nr:MAG: hypothetical protein A2161_21045 [Candidatus Schekmanbacteria bacterium RBG_13_48_7]